LYVIIIASPTASPLPAPSPSSSPSSSPPNISFLSLENKTYTANNISLNFTLSKSAKWIGYSIDGQANTTIYGNTTLTGLSNGSHTLTIYANDTYGNPAAPETITFTINKSTSFPTKEAAVAVSVASAVVLVAGLLVYFKKRKPATHRIIEGQTT
jgi:hypothetical protein